MIKSVYNELKLRHNLVKKGKKTKKKETQIKFSDMCNRWGHHT